MPIRSNDIVEKLYDIALDPQELETLVDVWTEAGLDNAQARQTVEAIDRFDDVNQVHLQRANTFLERGDATDEIINLDFVLRPFENLAAFIVDDSQIIALTNDTAQHFFGLDGNQPLVDILTANAELMAGKTTDASQAYTMELIRTETPWDDIILAAKGTKTWFWCGGEDPLMDIATIAAYRETYPWIDIVVIPEAGQMMIYQHFEMIIPKLAEAAKAAQAQ